MLPGGSGYSTRKQNMKLVTTKFKSGGLHEKHIVATWDLGNRLSKLIYDIVYLVITYRKRVHRYLGTSESAVGR